MKRCLSLLFLLIIYDISTTNYKKSIEEEKGQKTILKVFHPVSIILN